ncbi:UDP-N-acetylglucosamine--undecaprenyl-phosphate N-acetylglucosaminephosphotransferase [Vibrio vulnificus]|nr:UDP-N-acetylglucosamine--undecaprenyl-phosphate N-acetylglucosaminephosphotransferase [Vibrio vulnificus]
MLIDFLFLFSSSIAYLFILRKLAKKVELVDKPNERKLHQGQIPLVGGLAVCFSITQYLYYQPNLLPHHTLYVGCILCLTAIGVLDDKLDISFKIRIAAQIALSILLMWGTGISLKSLGSMFGFGPVELGPLGHIVTILAIVGAINAFNMVDGIDGLLGGLSTVTFASIALILYLHGNLAMMQFSLALCVAILPYILFNLGFFGKTRKVFMGDAGSMMIGFTVIYLLLFTTQNNTQAPMRPVTALWLIAIPLMDMVAVMVRRIRRGHSPFKPDREHFHHICQRIGLNSTQTLCLICACAMFCASIGIVGDLLKIPEVVMFLAFLCLFSVYVAILNRIWRITSLIRRFHQKLRISTSNL